MQIDVQVFFPEVPAFAEFAPDRAVYIGDVDGRCEVFARSAAGARQVTDRPQGTITCAIDPTGARVWWFDDDLGGVGRWRITPFGGGDSEDAGLPPGRAAGLAMSADGTAAVGVGHDGLSVYRRSPDGRVDHVGDFDGHTTLVDLSHSGRLAVLARDPEDPVPAVVLDLATGERLPLRLPGRVLWVSGFAPVEGPERLLLTAADDTAYRLAEWTPDGGVRELRWFDSDTEIAPTWYPDGRRVLVRRDRHARSELRELDLERRTDAPVPTPRGSILAAQVQPDGDLHYVWTDATHPPHLRTASGRWSLGGRRNATVAGVTSEVWVDTPAGPVHALLTAPDSPGPHPTVFLLHGGPHTAARDAYDALVSVFTGIGCTVVRPNYRGSTGYGPAWRNDFSDGPGHTQLLDLAAVREHLVAAGVADEDRTAVVGTSWGGYLALLAAGVQPELWRAVAAVNPIADYVAAYRGATPAVRALDRRIFGGDPDQRPAAYAAASPMSHVASVRAPVLILAGTEDDRCPPDQVAAYVAALEAHGVEHELQWAPSGHEGRTGAVHRQIIGSVVSFVATALGGREIAAPAKTG
ncbi:S9 family peptidase [Saccharothrix luteola]|uniref:S9 family peptidase n=1 Tax=Saccharothrix luteola TaxID=2893018 RepID=UPI001E3A3C1F|nr:alpha/beta fold hydrolase [Saccharothrix luteola]MCC8246721.1 alpha/beta fold hydrolase [Saccharothrix luteola]